MSLVVKGDWLIAEDAQAQHPQFEHEAFPVDRFQQPWSKNAVHLDGASDDPLSRCVNVDRLAPHGPTRSTKRAERFLRAFLEGRAPTRSDAGEDRPVAWISKTFASQFLDGRAVGEWIQISERWLELAGVVGDIRTFGLREDARPMAYLPVGNASVGLDVMHVIVRTGGAPGSMASDLRRVVDRVDASVPLTTARTIEDLVATSTAQTSFATTLLAIAAVIALVLGVVGLYGVISYIVTQRTAEIGIRLALGANPVDVCVMVLRQGLVVAVAGVAVGLAAALPWRVSWRRCCSKSLPTTL